MKHADILVSKYGLVVIKSCKIRRDTWQELTQFERIVDRQEATLLWDLMTKCDQIGKAIAKYRGE